MNKSRKSFVIRGFNVESAGKFNCIGKMSDLTSFNEVIADKQHDAVAIMLTNPSISSLGSYNLMNRKDIQVTPGKNPVDEIKQVYVVDLTIVTTASNVNELRPYRSAIREVIKTWAEKSRVKNRRGWRSSAIKTPTFEIDKSLGSVVIKTQIILSTAIFYDYDTATINVSFDPDMEIEDLRNLHRELTRYNNTDGYYSHLKYKHSIIGDGEILSR